MAAQSLGSGAGGLQDNFSVPCFFTSIITRIIVTAMVRRMIGNGIVLWLMDRK
jgi:hypothetical protein